MNKTFDKWKKEPSKKELYDIIKLQEERISELNKEMMKLNIVIRNEKPIRIDTLGLDYMVDLEQKYFLLQDIIKEVREYITNTKMFTYGEEKEFFLKDYWYGKELLEILGSDK